MKCFKDLDLARTEWATRSPYSGQMVELFRNLRDWFPEIPPDLWTIGYNVSVAEPGLQRGIEQLMTYMT